jgi:hypothetical protein
MRWPASALCLLAFHAAQPPAAEPAGPELVRYVRIELRGPERTLSLAEVQVVRDGRNLTKNAVATQSATDQGASAARAIDQGWDGAFPAGSVTLTPAMADPWWEVDLLAEQGVDQITVWNRTDCCGERLEGFRIAALDAERRVVWSRSGVAAPLVRVDFSLWGAPVTRLAPEKVDRAALQPAIDDAIARGVRFLEETQQRDGSWGAHAERHGCGQTALSVYALLKAGVPRSDPSIVRGLAYVEGNLPRTTYAAGCAMMALGTHDDPRYRPVMEAILDDLLEWQGAPDAGGRRLGMYGYPEGTADLSNTQYAVLGLRAAALAGFEVPERTWEDLLEGLLRYQEQPRVVSRVVVPVGRSGTGKTTVAGFSYHAGGARVTGSMTTAGVSSITICEWALGRSVPRKIAGPAATARRYGLQWLAENFSVAQNPGAGGGNLDYYLYGLERVGSVLGTDRIGEHDWYWEGAEKLVQRQQQPGSWASSESATCFALLFLSRATASTGVDSKLPEHLYLAEGEGAAVRWRITGERPMTLFVTGFSETALTDYDDSEGEVRGLRVLEILYRAGDEVVARVPGDAAHGWQGERFPAQWGIPRPGSYELTCVARVVDPFGAEGEGTVELVSDPIAIEVKDTGAEWMTAYVSDAKDNLLAGHQPEVSASSVRSDGQAPAKAIDGLHGTAWVAAKTDPRPSITIELERPIRANVVLLSHVGRNAREAGTYDRATKALLRLNRGTTDYAVELAASDLEKTVFRLPKTVNVRRLQVEIVERAEGSVHKGAVGFSEIELLRER